MKFSFAFTAAIMLAHSLSFAQSNYKPGYVITTKGDTLKGFIDVREWSTDPKKINFKTSVDNKNSRELGVNDITFFAPNNMETHQRYAGLLNNDPTDISNLPAGRDTSVITDTVFLKIIQKGDKITLFEYTDSKKDHFFVTETQDNQPKELIYRIYKNDGRTINENGYKQQLYVLAQKFNDIPNLKLKIENADYQYTKLVEISRLINKYTGRDDNATTAKRRNASFFISAGFNINKLTFGYALAGSDQSGITTKKISTSASYFPRLATGINILSNPNTGNLVFRIEAAITANQGNVVNNESERYSVSQYTFSLIPQLLYNFYNAKNLKFYGGIGASLNLSSYDSDSNNAYGFSSKWTSFPLHVGAVINKKIDVSVAYIPNATFTNAVFSYVEVRAIQVALNYNFK